ncbi:MAG TPA: AAA family ATPase, partial [Dyadobacter sp.]|nr:AAA family ATPase [Dyadobacter sp.]
MIPRIAKEEIDELLADFPAVGVFGPRQIGKTTLAELVAESLDPKPIYLDLENPLDLAKLNEPEAY